MSGSGRIAASSPIRGPSTKRPSLSRSSSLCTSSATASRWAVARGRSVEATSSASVEGAAATASTMAIALSMTPIPLCCPTTRYYCLNIRDRKRNERSMGKTLAEKLWESHVVHSAPGEPDLLYIDMHLVHEVTSPQAFDGLRLAGRTVHRPDLTLATEDHNVPTQHIELPIADPVSRTQVETLRKNCAEFGVELYPMGNAEQGIVHVIGPQLGITQPGMTIVCGDSHTSTHGAFGALAFGIGTSQVEHVLATQTLPMGPFRTMAVNVTGRLQPGVTAKDVILAVIARIGTGGGQGYVIEYRGEAVRALSMEARMTVCNMSIEAGARAGMIAPGETTFAFLQGRAHAPSGDLWDKAVEAWLSLGTDADATFDAEVHIDAAALTPYVTWGTNPGQGLPLSERVPDPEALGD